jgi:hypothetical protein
MEMVEGYLGRPLNPKALLEGLPGLDGFLERMRRECEREWMESWE